MRVVLVFLMLAVLVGCQQDPPRMVHLVIPSDMVSIGRDGKVFMNTCLDPVIRGKVSTSLYYEDHDHRIQILPASKWTYTRALVIGEGDELICDAFTAVFAPADLLTTLEVHVNYEGEPS